MHINVAKMSKTSQTRPTRECERGVLMYVELASDCCQRRLAMFFTFLLALIVKFP